MDYAEATSSLWLGFMTDTLLVLLLMRSQPSIKTNINIRHDFSLTRDFVGSYGSWEVVTFSLIQFGLGEYIIN